MGGGGGRGLRRESPAMVRDAGRVRAGKMKSAVNSVASDKSHFDNWPCGRGGRVGRLMDARCDCCGGSGSGRDITRFCVKILQIAVALHQHSCTQRPREIRFQASRKAMASQQGHQIRQCLNRERRTSSRISLLSFSAQRARNDINSTTHQNQRIKHES
jgi:hypothetical protein